MNKKKVMIVVFVISVLVGITYYFLFRNSQLASPAFLGVKTPSEGCFPIGKPEENRVIFGKIQSFIKSAKSRGAPGTYLISEFPVSSAPSAVPDYSIVFFEDKTTFVITIYKRPLSDTRLVAEQDLLKKIGLSEEEACHLNVNLGTIASVDENLSGKNFGLSFCPNGTPFPKE